MVKSGLLPLLTLLVVSCTQHPSSPASSLTWQAINQGITPHVHVTSLAVHPRHLQQMWAGVYTREALYASADGGASWQTVGGALVGHAVFTLQVDPVQTDTLWAGSADGLYRGTRRGIGLDLERQRVAAGRCRPCLARGGG